MWGMKGTEDLGGGAYVLVGNNMGSVSLGLRSNPNTDAFAQALPVMGNSVTQVRNVIGFASGDFIKN